MSKLVRILATLLLTVGWSTANALIINLNATTSDGGPDDIFTNAITINLMSTDLFTINQIGTAGGGMYDAWNPWGFVSGCTDGANCEHGWVTYWGLYLDGDINSLSLPGGGGTYETPALALANATALGGPFTGVTSLSFGIWDDIFNYNNVYGDNLGGVSLELIIETVSEPPTILLFVAIMLGLVFSRRRMPITYMFHPIRNGQSS